MPALLALVTVFAGLFWAGEPAQAGTSAAFTPGAAWTDQNGHPLQMHGLGIVKAGGTWYAYGEDKTGEASGDTSFQDIPCYSSTNLSTWTYQGVALARQAAGDLGPNRIVERPKVVHNAVTGKYVMYMHIDNTDYTERKVGVAVSSTPCGPYTYQGSFNPLGFQSLDMNLFQDTDGSAYLLSDDRPDGTRIDRLSADYLSVAGAVALLPAGIGYESPAMAKAGSTYYLLLSHQSGWGTNDNVYATAASLSGTWSAFKNFAPAGTNTYNTQTANIIPVTGSAGTTYIYAGDRWDTANLGTSPLVWLPLTISGTTVNVGWQNSWTLDVAAGTWSGTSNPGAAAGSYLTNRQSSLAMDVSGASKDTSGRIIQWTDHHGLNQQWTLTRVAGNVYTLRNVNSGLCLAPSNDSIAAGVQLGQSTCDIADPGRQWAFDAVGPYTAAADADYELVNLGSGQAIDVLNNSTAIGAAVGQWPTDGGANQDWVLS
ncbi:RICIN domain-containing protein [Catenulispora rubra]|uniref:RICIN domain-containing protein n=1 Tax=Catenulispora rubra TaxID=280293 RepID=UPI002B276494|nr:RICIN domain-containing protein [Catenulispora rubra]